MGGPRRIAIGVAAALLLAHAAPALAMPPGTWIPGDLHVHTCYSHDAYCGPGDDNTGPDTIYSSAGTVKERFLEASAKGLEFLAITDHDDIRSQADPDFGSMGVTGIPAYEASLDGGHAQMLGATKQYPKGKGNATATNAMANALRGDGGVFQANHPAYRLDAPVTGCAQLAYSNWDHDPMHWRYGFAVRPDTIEVWNTTSLVAPAELFWECWLARGARIGATGGSDSHGANTLHIGFPTTWVHARSAKVADLLEAIRAGRTTLSRVAPRQGAVRLLIEGDRDGDGSWESSIGDRVPPGSALRARALGTPGRGLLLVRANGKTIVDGAVLGPGGEVRFRAPAQAPGWVRATLYLQNGTDAVDPSCGPGFPTGEAVDVCSKDLARAAMTSPIWIARPKPPPPPPPDGTPRRGRRIGGLRVAWDHESDAERPRVYVHWSGATGRVELQGRHEDGAWRAFDVDAGESGIVVRLERGHWTFRIRSSPRARRPGPWTVAQADI
jgi:hypothetical protein